MSSLLVKTKTPLSHQRDKGVNLCGTTLLAGKAQRSGHSGMPGNGGGPEGPTAGSALCSKGIFPASSRPPCTKRRLSVRLGGGYSAFSAHSCDILSYLIRFPAACQEFLLPILCAWGILALAEGTGGPVCQPYGFTRAHLSNGRTGGDTRPCENTGSCPVNAVGAGPRPARRSRIMFGARRRGQAPALQKTDVQKVGENLSRRAAVCQPCDFTRAHLSNGRAGGDTRPYRERRGSRFAVGAADLGGPRAHTVRPYGGNRTGSVSSANLGAEMGPQLLKFLHTQAPSGAGWDRTQALLILRAERIPPALRSNPRNGGPRGAANMDTKCPS